jgi:hypothetical protein
LPGPGAWPTIAEVLRDFSHIRGRRAFWLRLTLACVIAAGALPASALAGISRHPAGAGFTDVQGATAASNATALSKQLWSSTTLDLIANDVAGTTDMNVLVEDDPNEWATFFPPDVDSTSVLGFVSLSYPALYHKIILAPTIYPAFASWFSTGTPQGNEYLFSVAVMSLIHESFHWRLMSGDESTVNACALKFFPYYIERDFSVPSTVSQTTTQDVPTTTTTKVPVTHLKVTKYRVKVRGKWVTKTKRTKITTYVTKTTTTYVSQTVTTAVPNPLFQTLVADAADFYAHQPPPYNAGTCTV